MMAVVPDSSTNQVKYRTNFMILSAAGGVSGVGFVIWASTNSYAAVMIMINSFGMTMRRPPWYDREL